MDYSLRSVRWETQSGKWRINAVLVGYELINVEDCCNRCGFHETIDEAIEEAKRIDKCENT